MDIIESMKKDKAYMKCKLIVKTWEKEFKIKHSRTPTKFDIKEAPTNIKYAYKKYFQLKSAALEDSLSICDIDDDVIISPEPIPQLENAAESLSPQPELPTLPTGQELEELLSSTDIPKNLKVPTLFTENLSKKLFKNRTFSLRNPRKLSLPKIQTLTQNKSLTFEDTTNDNEKLFDEDVISIRDISNFDSSFTITEEPGCSKTMTVSTNVLSAASHKTSPMTRQLDQSWLARATGLSQISENKHKPEIFGIRNLQIPDVKEKFKDYVENSESEGEDDSIDKLKPALKKRKLENVDTQTYIKHEESSSKNGSDEKKYKSKTNNSKMKSCKNNEKRDEQQPPDISEYLPFGLEKDICPRHSQVSSILEKVDTIISDSYSGANNASKECEILANKIKNGTLNDNFVKINIEKKVFVRGKKSINYSKYKKQQWKDKKSLHGGMEFPENGKVACFKCGGKGHMARYCPAQKGEVLLPLDSYNENDNMPTLEEMQKYASKLPSNSVTLTEELNIIAQTSSQTSQIPDSFMKLLAESEKEDLDGNVKPIYSSLEESDSTVLYETLQKFGHKSFRSGQEKAVKRILCGMSTLLILPTGGGKSLCYQLPAFIYSQHYKCITLVISPLVSLMEDQVLNVPDFLKAGCYHTNQPPTQRRKILECLKEGLINILLISPEALVSGDTSNGLSGLFKSLPPIAFACIDEAHCVSQWSHNFRPSYLMICRVLREKLNVKCILGLTATASQTAIKSIISHINIPDGMNGVITNPALPDNLWLSVSIEKDKDKALVSYLLSEQIISFNSIIVYCIRRDECERVAAVLRACLQETGKINMESKNGKRKRMSYIAEAYHAGMSGAQRKKIQKHFMDGTLRIIVATVAFGMGINKSDIRCIIHYNMPSSFESYVQEVGRAGRDGRLASCHVILNNSNNDKNELLKHIHANSIDRPTIRKLLNKVFIPCECVSNKDISTTSNSNYCKGHEVGILIDTTVEELDLPSENIATLLCYVELHPKQYIKLLNNAYINCKISSYGGPKKIIEAAKSCRPLAMALLIETKKAPDTLTKSVLEFNVIEVAAAIGLESGITKYQLKNLEWITEAGMSRRSFLKVEFNTLGFRIRSRGDLNSTELDSILDDIHKSVISQEKARLYQLEECNKAFHELGKYSLNSFQLSKEMLIDKSNDLKLRIRNYFDRPHLPSDMILEEQPIDVERVKCDVRSLICSYKDCTFSGRSIARIFHGISSPNYPAIVWGRCKFWRSHIHEDFNSIIKIATQQIIQMKL